MIDKPITATAAELMVQAMHDLRAKKIDAKEATAMAQLGIGIVQAANAEVAFIKAVKGLPMNGAMGNKVSYLEP